MTTTDTEVGAGAMTTNEDPAATGTMTIAIGADHRGSDAAERIARRLESRGFTVPLDVAPLKDGDRQSVDYPDSARTVAELVGSGAAARGILICGSGLGMSISANKVRGVRAALAMDALAAEMSRRHNDANVLCLSADRTEDDDLDAIVETWLATEFEGGRHGRRVEKISRLECD